VKKGTMQESEKAAILSRIKTTLDMKDAGDADTGGRSAEREVEIRGRRGGLARGHRLGSGGRW